MENVSKEMLERSDEMISKMTADEIRALFEENDKLRQELRIRDNDILSHDQVFDSIVRGTYHVILVMSVTTFKAEFITANIDAALGIDRAEAMEDVRMIGHSFENIEDHNGREEIFIHRTNGTRRQFLVYVIHLPYGRSDRVAVVLLCKSSRVRGDFEEMMIQQTEDGQYVPRFQGADQYHFGICHAAHEEFTESFQSPGVFSQDRYGMPGTSLHPGPDTGYEQD